MRNAPSSYQTTPRETAEFAAGALFVDLDETITRDQAINGLSVEEIARLELNEAVVAKMEQASAAGVPVVMVTRNNAEWIERFFEARPELRPLFTDTLPCPTGNKSDAINAWLSTHDLLPECAAFADDQERERRDVFDNVEGARVYDPSVISKLRLNRAAQTRRQVGELITRRSTVDTDEILLAA